MNAVAKRVVTGLTIGAGVIAAVVLSPVWLIRPVVALLIVLTLAEFTCLLKRKVPSASATFIVLFALGAAIIAGGLWSLTEIAARHGNLMLLYVLAIVKFSDVGGFACGMTCNKLSGGRNHKLCPSISPNKSWEGLIGSVLFSCIVSCAFLPITHYGAGRALAFGVAAALVGTAGDLVESKFKRWVGVKDSSAFAFTNGLGGLLDMLDSLLLAPAAFLVFL